MEEDNENRKAFFEVSYELLKALLSLPIETEILTGGDAKHYGSLNHDAFRIYVRSPALEPVPPGSIAPQVSPRYRRSEEGTEEFIGWK